MYCPNKEPHELEPGEWTFGNVDNTEDGLWARLPNGGLCDLRTWNVSGPKEAPTVTPSIQTLPRDAVDRDGNPSAWHGYLTDGKFISC